jgi:hypothetical protein
MAKVFNGIDRVGLWFVSLILGFMTPFAAYGFSRSLGNHPIFFGGMAISGFISLEPVLIFVAIYLLWWTPEKYKERGIRQR